MSHLINHNKKAIFSSELLKPFNFPVSLAHSSFSSQPPNHDVFFEGLALLKSDFQTLTLWNSYRKKQQQTKQKQKKNMFFKS